MTTATAEAPVEAPQVDNLQIWDEAYETDRRYCQQFRAPGGFQGTAIKPMYLVRKATETFGPIGQGWGFQQIAHHQLKAENSPEVCWYSYVELWYRHPKTGELCKVYQYGGSKLCAERRGSGVFVDDEAPKKAITDAVTKCLSYLGFGADIHMGDTEDSKYLSKKFQDSGSSNSRPQKTRSAGTLAPGSQSAAVSAAQKQDQKSQVEQIKQTIARVNKPESLTRLADDLTKVALSFEDRIEINKLLDARGRELTPDAQPEPALTE